jgi:hypothetical protein
LSACSPLDSFADMVHRDTVICRWSMHLHPSTLHRPTKTAMNHFTTIPINPSRYTDPTINNIAQHSILQVCIELGKGLNAVSHLEQGLSSFGTAFMSSMIPLKQTSRGDRLKVKYVRHARLRYSGVNNELETEGRRSGGLETTPESARKREKIKICE